MGFRNLPEMKPNNKPQFAGVGFDFGGGETDHPVTSVNGETGAVVLDAADVGALPSDTSIPTKTSDLENDSGFVDSDIIAPVEATSTASQAYTVGQYFINSLGQLCRVTVDIASGGTITVGTNCVVEPVGAALTSLNSNITWRFLDDATGSQEHINLPSNNNWEELCVYWYDGFNSTYRLTQIIPRVTLDKYVSTVLVFVVGSKQDHYGEIAAYSSREIGINFYYTSENDYTSSAKIEIYIR